MSFSQAGNHSPSGLTLRILLSAVYSQWPLVKPLLPGSLSTNVSQFLQIIIAVSLCHNSYLPQEEASLLRYE